MPLPPSFPSDAHPAHTTAHSRAVLQELVEIGGALANAIHGVIALRSPELSRASLVQLANAFELVTNSMCRNILLDQKLAEPPPSPTARRAAIRQRIIQEVERAIRRRTSGAAADALCAEMLEHLEVIELAEDFTSPVAEIIRDMCRDLGVAGRPGDRRWQRRRPADLAELYERAARVPPGTYRPAPLHRAAPRLVYSSDPTKT